MNTGKVTINPVETEKLLGLKRLAVNASFKTRLVVANSCFMSIIIYMVSVWGGT